MSGLPAQVGPRTAPEVPDCPADNHQRSYRAWMRNGRICVCPGVLAHATECQERIKARRRVRREARTAAQDAVRLRSQMGIEVLFDLSEADQVLVDAVLAGSRIRRQYVRKGIYGLDKHTTAEIARRMVLSRRTDREIAEAVGVDVRTACRYVRTLRTRGLIPSEGKRVVNLPSWSPQRWAS